MFSLALSNVIILGLLSVTVINDVFTIPFIALYLFDHSFSYSLSSDSALGKTIKMTESPLKNILEMNRSLLAGMALFLPRPRLPASVHISRTCSRTKLQWRSKALTRARSLRLLRQEMRTGEWVRRARDKRLKGPFVNSYSSKAFNSSSFNSDFGLLKEENEKREKWLKMTLFLMDGLL